MLSREATNTNFIVFGLTRSGLEAMIYCTQGKHANHYITDAVDRTIDVVCIVHKCVLYRTTDVVCQGSTMRPKHSHLRVSFVKCEYKFCIDSQKARLYIWKIFVPSSIVFFNLNSDFDYPVF